MIYMLFAFGKMFKISLRKFNKIKIFQGKSAKLRHKKKNNNI